MADIDSKHSFLEVKEKMKAYCAYRECCTNDVIRKATRWGTSPEKVNSLVSDLKREGFLNEERYAFSFVADRFKLKKWGRLKITQSLKRKNIDDVIIERALNSIDEEAYKKTIAQLVKKRSRLKSYNGELDKKIKIKEYLTSKGYELQLIYDALA